MTQAHCNNTAAQWLLRSKDTGFSDRGTYTTDLGKSLLSHLYVLLGFQSVVDTQSGCTKAANIRIFNAPLHYALIYFNRRIHKT